MPLMILGNWKKHPERATYRGLDIELWTADRGALHCEKLHDHRATACMVCGAAVGATQVYVAFVNDEVASLDHEDKNDAIEAARQSIEDVLNPTGEHDMASEESAGKKRRKKFGALHPQAKRVSVREQMKKMGWGEKVLAELRRKSSGEKGPAGPRLGPGGGAGPAK
ncbi:MAG: hypothetical protein RLZZ324_360 [Candidatus Parcubacteria bacterium]